MQPQKASGSVRNWHSLKQIFKELRQTINYNFSSTDKNQLAITLTYAENMQDSNRLYLDFKKFMMRLKHSYPEHNFEYIVIVEPQGRGAWHCHMLLKTTNQKELYIPDNDIARIWGHGFTKTERLKNVDQYGAYFVAYLTNAEVTPEREKELEIEANDIEIKNGKKVIKGERLKWYPEYMQIWRHSRGIEKAPQETIDIGTENGYNMPDLKLGVKIYENEKEIETDKRALKIITQQYKK